MGDFVSRYPAIAVSLGLAVVSPAALRAQDSVTAPSCELYEANSRGRFQGTLAKLSFPGPPNYSSIADGDAREDIIALRPTTRVCRAFENDVFYVVWAQLLLTPAQARFATSLLGAEVLVYGTTAEAEAGHHHTAMLIAVDSLRTVPRSPSPH